MLDGDGTLARKFEAFQSPNRSERPPGEVWAPVHAGCFRFLPNHHHQSCKFVTPQQSGRRCYKILFSSSQVPLHSNREPKTLEHERQVDDMFLIISKVLVLLRVRAPSAVVRQADTGSGELGAYDQLHAGYSMEESVASLCHILISTIAQSAAHSTK